MNLSAGDLDDFNMIVKRNGEAENNFTLDLVNKVQDDKSNSPYIEAYFLVTKIPTKIQKKYDAGPGNLWLNLFENDLKNNFFK